MQQEVSRDEVKRVKVEEGVNALCSERGRHGQNRMREFFVVKGSSHGLVKSND